jgi:hypothetical protein
MVISLQELALLISEGEGQVPLEKVVEDSPYLELGDYCVIARRQTAGRRSPRSSGSTSGTATCCNRCSSGCGA